MEGPLLDTTQATADRIVVSLTTLGGRPHVDGTKLGADVLLGYLLSMTPAEVEAEFDLQPGDMAAVIRYAADVVRRQADAPPSFPPPRLYALEVGRVWAAPTEAGHKRVRERLREVWPFLADALDNLARYA